MTREPQTEAGRELAHLGCCTSVEEVRGIEAEAWNAALQAVEEAVGGMRAFEHDGDFVRDARDEVPELHYVNRSGVLSRIAALRKGA